MALMRPVPPRRARRSADVALDFPASPGIGQTYTGPGGIFWQWDGVKWVNGAGLAAYAPVESPAFTGSPTAPNPAADDADTSIATTAFVQAALAPSSHNVGRNLLHNPLFNVAQRGEGPWTSSTGFTADRWARDAVTDAISYTRPALTDADRAAIGDEAAVYCLQNVFTGNAAAGSFNYLSQAIERVRRLAGKTVTVSFYAKTAVGTVPKVGLNALQNFGSGGSPSANAWALTTGTAVTLSTTWTRYTVTLAIPSVVGKTLGTNGDDSTALALWFSSGITNNALSGNIGVQSGTISIWGVQLEIGSSPSPLEKPEPQQDLADCQRFYQVGTLQIYGYQGASSLVAVSNLLPVTMRHTPVVTPTFSVVTNVTAPSMSEFGAAAVNLSGTVTAAGAYALQGDFTASAGMAGVAGWDATADALAGASGAARAGAAAA